MDASSTIVDELALAFRLGGDRPAVSCEQLTLSYRQLGAVVAALAHKLADDGAHGERVAIALPNGVGACAGILGGLAAGAQVALLNPKYPPAALAPLFDDADPTIVITNEPHVQELAAARHVPQIPFTDHSIEALTHGPPELPDTRPRPDQHATLMYTGGTTGISKGVDHTHRNLLRTVSGMEACWPTRLGQETWLNVAPMFHIWGLLMGCLNPIYRRAHLIIAPAFDPSKIARLMAQHEVTVFGGGPAAIYSGLLSALRTHPTTLDSLRVCPGGGSSFPVALLEEWEAEVGVPIYEAFGMSEIAPISTNPFGGIRKPGSVGLPAPGVEIRIADLGSGRTTLERGEVGEICVRSDRTMIGYRNRDDETAATVVDGWLRTGDIGHLDEDGYLFIVDRKKDMLLVGGFNVYPREIDEVLCSHPDVGEAATVGIEDERKGERPLSFVVTADGCPFDEELLQRHCAEHLVDYKRPARIIEVDEIPKTAANKTDRAALRRRASTSSVGQ